MGSNSPVHQNLRFDEESSIHATGPNRCDGSDPGWSTWEWVIHRGRPLDFIPPFAMGQYFKAVNVSKQEVVCPWCLGGGAKLWEWSANTQGAIFTLLLRKSDDRGGGDFREATFETDPEALVGRWAGDHVVLVGDYDSSGLYQKSKRFRNLSHELAEVWNPPVGSPASPSVPPRRAPQRGSEMPLTHELPILCAVPKRPSP